MDTTLRDGEQTSGVSFVPHEKLMIARLLLEELNVDRVEVASARVSEGEFDAVKMICRLGSAPQPTAKGRGTGICRWALIARLDSRHRMPGHQLALQRLVETLHLPVKEDGRRAPHPIYSM